MWNPESREFSSRDPESFRRLECGVLYRDPEFTAWNAESKKTGSDHLTWGRENRGKCMCTSHGDIVDGLRAFQNKSKKNSGKVKVL